MLSHLLQFWCPYALLPIWPLHTHKPKTFTLSQQEAITSAIILQSFKHTSTLISIFKFYGCSPFIKIKQHQQPPHHRSSTGNASFFNASFHWFTHMWNPLIRSSKRSVVPQYSTVQTAKIVAKSTTMMICAPNHFHKSHSNDFVQQLRNWNLARD